MSDDGQDSGGWSGDAGGVSTRREKADDEAIAFGRKFGLGCFTFIIGGFSGGMVAVLLGMGIEAARRSPKCDGLPVCNWYVYVGIGGLLGALTLPTLILTRLRRR